MTRYMIIIYYYWQIKGVLIIIIYVCFSFGMFVLHIKLNLNLQIWNQFNWIWKIFDLNMNLIKFYLNFIE
jgi:hypothetical protein